MKKLIKREDLQLENKADGIYGNAGKPSKHDLKTSQKHHRKHQKGLPCGMSDEKKYHIQYNVGDNIQMDSDGHRHGPVFADGGIGAAPSAGEGVGECGGDCGGGLGEKLGMSKNINTKNMRENITEDSEMRTALMQKYFPYVTNSSAGVSRDQLSKIHDLQRDLAKKFGYGSISSSFYDAVSKVAGGKGPITPEIVITAAMQWLDDEKAGKHADLH